MLFYVSRVGDNTDFAAHAVLLFYSRNHFVFSFCSWRMNHWWVLTKGVFSTKQKSRERRTSKTERKYKSVSKTMSGGRIKRLWCKRRTCVDGVLQLWAVFALLSSFRCVNNWVLQFDWFRLFLFVYLSSGNDFWWKMGWEYLKENSIRVSGEYKYN